MRTPLSRITMIALLASTAILATLGLHASAQDDEPISLPVTEGLELKEGEGREAVVNNCLKCHTLKPILTHDGFTPETWAAEVDKMRNKYGAEITDEDAAEIVAYLRANYANEAPSADDVLLYGYENAIATPRAAPAAAATPSGSPEAAPDQAPSD